MEEGEEKKFVCEFCNKTFSCAKGRGGHVRIHYSKKKNSDRYNGNKKRSLVLMGQREKQKQQQDCTICRKKFASLEALEDHMACHNKRDPLLLDGQSDTDSETRRKRSKRAMKRSSSESFSNESLSFSGVDHDVGVAAYTLMMTKSGGKSSYKERHNFVMNSMGENYGVVKTKSSGKKHIKICDLKSQVTEADKIADGSDQLTSADGVTLCDSDGSDSDSDYFMNGPKKSDSDSCADTNSKIHRFIDSKSPMVKKAGGEEKESKIDLCLAASSDTDDE